MFTVSYRPDGIGYVSTNSTLCRRWPHHLSDVDWSTIAKGTRVLVVDVYRAKHLPPISQPRPDGLHEIELARTPLRRYELGYGSQKKTYENVCPVFIVPGDPKRRPAKVFGNFAWADDPGMVAGLLEYLALERADRELAHLFSSYTNGARRELEAAKRKAAVDERRRLLADKAKSVGVSVDELEAGIAIWNKLRRKRFSATSCLCCGRRLSDPASIVSGIGPECIRHLPAIRAAAKAKVIDIGKMRWDGDRLVERFKRAGVDELVRVVEDARQLEAIVAGSEEDR